MRSTVTLLTLLIVATLMGGCNQTTSTDESRPVTQEAPPPQPAATTPAPESKTPDAKADKAAAPAASSPASTDAPGKGSRWSNDPNEVKLRLNSVKTLIESSSGAKKIESSGSPEASALREKARSLHAQAESAAGKGDYAEATQLLGQASKTIFEGVQVADHGASKQEKGQKDFDRRLDSVNALLDAHDRISREKGGGGGETSSKIQELIGKAKTMSAAGQLDEGRKKLDEAYIIAKLGVEKMRRGDTLVRSLNFASKEEEYHYEVDRNNTHKMLINMLIKNQSSSDPMLQQFVEKAATLRQEAENQGSKGDFENAIKTLEMSTQELIKAIRGAGIFIPS